MLISDILHSVTHHVCILYRGFYIISMLSLQLNNQCQYEKYDIEWITMCKAYHR